MSIGIFSNIHQSVQSFTSRKHRTSRAGRYPDL